MCYHYLKKSYYYHVISFHKRGKHTRLCQKSHLEYFAYIHSTHIQILIAEYPGDDSQVITRFQYQCSNMMFTDEKRYNRLFQKVVHKGGKSSIKYIKIFQSSKALEILFGNNYYKEQIMHFFMISTKVLNSSQIAIHQA